MCAFAKLHVGTNLDVLFCIGCILRWIGLYFVLLRVNDEPDGEDNDVNQAQAHLNPVHLLYSLKDVHANSLFH